MNKQGIPPYNDVVLLLARHRADKTEIEWRDMRAVALSFHFGKDCYRITIDPSKYVPNTGGFLNDQAELAAWDDWYRFLENVFALVERGQGDLVDLLSKFRKPWSNFFSWSPRRRRQVAVPPPIPN